MDARRTLKIVFLSLIGLALLSALGFGIAFGSAIASTRNIMSIENFEDFSPALPSKILDIEGRLITEFASDEKRTLIPIKELPQHLIDAVITREDETFWTHPGFTLKGYFRAFLGIVLNRNMGGGSTITLQLATNLYADKRDISFRRKAIELWWALQLERRFTKQEILEEYLNRVNMGPGIYGVEAASQYYFGHSAREATLAESAILALTFSGPSKYNPIRNPYVVQDRSRWVLDQMVEKGYATKEAADESFSLYWDNLDYTRVSTAAYYNREDKAPWFSDYVRQQLEQMLYGNIDLYTDGLTVHTTLNLDYQAVADRYMSRYIEQANKSYLASSSRRLDAAGRLYAPMSELLGLGFNLEGMFFQSSRLDAKVLERYRTQLNPTVDAMALMFGLSPLKLATNASYGEDRQSLARNTVEGALITLDNEKGYILAMVGGSQFSEYNQFNRATIAKLMPGSSFKPLYYSAAMDSRRFTPGTLIWDAPVVFYNEDGTPYTPLNFKGEWKGQVLTWYALAKSMNVPSMWVLDGIGFDLAINRAAALLDIRNPEEIRKTFPRRYPLALGVIGVSPIKMARAYSVFANQGKEITPIAIRSIEDRAGKIILEPEKDLRAEQKKKGSAIQVISPQNAYLMTDLLSRVVAMGTLSSQTAQGSIFTYKDESGKRYTIPAAGKTGTTDNWEDAWTVGFTPYMTTAIWFGFDQPGNSLGVDQSGAMIAGTAWALYMSEVHKDLPYKAFVRPQSGLVDVRVCALSGLLPTEYCSDGTVALTFLEGTQPSSYCDLHQFTSEEAQKTIRDLAGQRELLGGGMVDSALETTDLPDLDALLKQLLEGTPPQDVKDEEPVQAPPPESTILD